MPRLALLAAAVVVWCWDTPADDTLVWKYASETSSDLGDPLVATSYALCLYDAAGDAQPVLRAVALAAGTCGGRPCWKRTASALTMRNRDGTPTGLSGARLQAGSRTRLRVKGRGAQLNLPTLPRTAPLTVQLQRTGTAAPCWEATYTTPRQNDARRFSSRSVP